MTVLKEDVAAATTGRGIFAAIRHTSVTSILTIVFGVATNKLIAVFGGAEGVGLLGLYRTLVGILAATLPLGVNDIVIRRLSTSGDRQTTEKVISASFAFLTVQILFVMGLAFFGARLVATLLFHSADSTRYVWPIRVTLGLTAGVLALQSVNASLNGLVRFRDVNLVNVTTSLLTLATVYPFLLLGGIGLAFVIGFTCLIGAGFGLVLLQRALGKPLHRLARPRDWTAFRAALPLSPWLALQPLLNTGSALAVQIVLTRHYGVSALGYYNAAAMLETTSVTVLMSSMRSYTLPTLGGFATFAQKRVFVNRILSVLLVLLLGGAMILVAGAPVILKILFSRDFEPAQDLVRIMAISMVSQVFVWCSAMFLLHGADYRTYLFLDFIWASVRVLGTLLCLERDWPVEYLAWTYVASYALSGVCYLIALRVRYRAFLIDRRNCLLAMLVLALLIVARLIFRQGHIGWRILFAAVVAGLCGAVGVSALRRMRGANA